MHETTLIVPSGGNLVITGENGVGKSTLLYLCAGLIPATGGRVRIGGLAPSVSRPSEMFRSGVRRGFVFHSGGLLSNMTALGNVTLALRYHADVLNLDEPQIDAAARELLSEMRVAQTDYHALPAHLSVGVRRRVSLARALALDPNFLFFDDPDANLDRATRKLVYDLLERFRNNPSLTMVLATASRELTERLALTPRELAHGQLMAAG